MKMICVGNLVRTHPKTAADERLVQAIHCSGETQLTKLELCGSATWWADPELKELCKEVLFSQTRLEELNINNNHTWTSEMFLEFLQWFTESSNMETLRVFICFHTPIFETDESCELLAMLLDITPKLKRANFGQTRSIPQRKIYAKINYDTGNDDGLI